jgi:DNA-directed RNA polymerase specialized sigma24 family protein
MEKLPAEQRAALIFRDVEGLSYQEMSEAMGCSIGTVMSRLHYGRKRIQELLKDYVRPYGQNGGPFKVSKGGTHRSFSEPR